jgi:membrane protein DedA with SNARE-associated domain
VIDGFFPPVPAETLVVATAAALSAAGTNWFVFVVLWLMVAAGAVCGDCVTYSLGRWFNAPSWRIFAGRRGQTALNWARRLFGRGAAVLLMVGRFIPVGRVAVNLTAGTIGYPMRRFVMIDSLAAVCWAAYSAGIGLVAGQVTRDNPLAAVVIGVTFSSLVGGLIQWLMNRHYGRQLEVSAGLVADTAEAGDGSENRSTAGPAEPE